MCVNSLVHLFGPELDRDDPASPATVFFSGFFFAEQRSICFLIPRKRRRRAVYFSRRPRYLRVCGDGGDVHCIQSPALLARRSKINCVSVDVDFPWPSCYIELVARKTLFIIPFFWARPAHKDEIINNKMGTLLLLAWPVHQSFMIGGSPRHLRNSCGAIRYIYI